MEDPNKRLLLKAGVLLSSGGWMSFSLAQQKQNNHVFKDLAKHRWIPPYPINKKRDFYSPVLAKNVDQTHDLPLSFWLQTNLDLIRKYRINPLRAARTLSYLLAALHDTVVSCLTIHGNSTIHSSIAIHLVAGEVLEHLFPEENRGRWIGEGIKCASGYASQVGSDWKGLWDLSQDISQRTIAHAITDGSARINALAQPPKNIPLTWKATPPMWSSRPVEPGAAGWRTWLTSATVVGEQCPAPLTLNNGKYVEEVLEVYGTYKTLTPQQKKIAEDWNLELGTVTPPGVWIMKAIENADFQKLSLIERTSLLSLLTTAMMDAFIACWYVKFKWWTERPVTAIRRMYDPNFLPYVLTPAFPSYTSGHATVSGAAAFVLSTLLPQKNDEWNKAADEAAISRLYGGIHFRSDNEEGLALGKKVAEVGINKLGVVHHG